MREPLSGGPGVDSHPRLADEHKVFALRKSHPIGHVQSREQHFRGSRVRVVAQQAAVRFVLQEVVGHIAVLAAGVGEVDPAIARHVSIVHQTAQPHRPSAQGLPMDCLWLLWFNGRHVQERLTLHPCGQHSHLPVGRDEQQALAGKRRGAVPALLQNRCE